MTLLTDIIKNTINRIQFVQYVRLLPQSILTHDRYYVAKSDFDKLLQALLDTLQDIERVHNDPLLPKRLEKMIITVNNFQATVKSSGKNIPLNEITDMVSSLEQVLEPLNHLLPRVLSELMCIHLYAYTLREFGHDGRQDSRLDQFLQNLKAICEPGSDYQKYSLHPTQDYEFILEVVETTQAFLQMIFRTRESDAMWQRVSSVMKNSVENAMNELDTLLASVGSSKLLYISASVLKNPFDFYIGNAVATNTLKSILMYSMCVNTDAVFTSKDSQLFQILLHRFPKLHGWFAKHLNTLIDANNEWVKVYSDIENAQQAATASTSKPLDEQPVAPTKLEINRPFFPPSPREPRKKSARIATQDEQIIKKIKTC